MGTISSAATSGRPGDRLRLPLGEVFLHGDRRGRGIPDGGGDLAGELGPEITGRGEPRNRGHHPGLGDAVPRRLVAGGAPLPPPPWGCTQTNNNTAAASLRARPPR